jgi:hypothetical protein
MIIMMLKT